MASTTTPLFYFLFHLLSFLQLGSAQNDVVEGGYWFPASGLAVSDIDSTQFTHLFCAFADLDSTTNRVLISASNQPQFSTFTSTVQDKNPSVKTLLSIGGGSSDPTAYAAMVSATDSRKSFIDSSITLARSNGFHGLDLDWEYPQSDTEMANFGSLLTEWRSAVAIESRTSGETPLLLTAAVFYSPNYGSPSYPIQTVRSSLDWMNAMAYDFSDPTRSTVTRSHAALFEPASQLSGSFGVEAWVKAGLPSEKIVLGVPFYGYAWRLVNGDDHGFYAPANGPVRPPDDGSMGFNQIQEFIAQNDAQAVYNDTMVTEYCYAGTSWIGFDGVQTVTTKAQYAKTNGLRGYFAWHVGADDHWALSIAGRSVF